MSMQSEYINELAAALAKAQGAMQNATMNIADATTPLAGPHADAVDAANARLIAAAPELLACLKALAAEAKWQNAPYDLLFAARDAIAAATGAQITSGEPQRDEAAVVQEPLNDGTSYGS